MKLEEITVAEWNQLDSQSNTYFCNGCIFDEETDNLIAFGEYEDALREVERYYKVVRL